MVSFIQLKPILDIFLRGFSLSSCPPHSLKVLLLLNSTCLFEVCNQLLTWFLIFHISFRINCYRISESLLYNKFSLSSLLHESKVSQPHELMHTRHFLGMLGRRNRWPARTQESCELDPSCLLFGNSRLILWDCSVTPQSLLEITGILSQIGPRTLPSTSFPIVSTDPPLIRHYITWATMIVLE
jgi:hypothetical protein